MSDMPFLYQRIVILTPEVLIKVMKNSRKKIMALL